MIGSAIAMRYIGKKPWILAIAFWAVYLIIGLIFVTSISSSFGWWLGLVLSLVVFMGLAIYWMRLAPIIAIVAFAVTYVVDFAIMYFMAIAGFSLASLLGGIGL